MNLAGNIEKVTHTESTKRLSGVLSVCAKVKNLLGKIFRIKLQFQEYLYLIE